VSFACKTRCRRHAVSIDPARTWIGCFLLVCLGAFWIGLTGLLDERLTYGSFKP